MSRVLVVGAGAIGGLLAARLHVAGHEVTATARPDTIAAMTGFGITGCTEFHDGAFMDAFVAKPEGRFDVAFVTGKATATVPLAGVAAAHADAVVSLQNGFGNGDKLLAAAGDDADRVAVALTSHGVTRLSPGRLHHAGTGPTLIGPAASGHDAAADTALSLLADGGFEPTRATDLRGALWQKALVNAAINPVAALYDVSNGELLDRDDRRGLSLAILAEATALSHLARVALPRDDLVDVVTGTLAATRDNACSMLQDVRARRPTEVEQIVGRMVRLNERLLGHTPKLEAVYGRIKDLEATYLGPAAAKQTAWDELAWEQAPF